MESTVLQRLPLQCGKHVADPRQTVMGARGHVVLTPLQRLPAAVFMLKYIKKRKANWIGHILRRNCLLQQVIEGKIKGQIEVIRRRGRRRKKLLDDLKDRRGYCQLKEEALDRTVWRNRFGRGFGPVF